MDDQKAREAAAKELFTIPGVVIEDMWERIASINPAQADEWRADASRVIDAYLAALPVAPEQPTQANEEGDPTEWSEARAEDWRRIRIEGGKALHKALRACGIDARFAMSGPGELADVIDLLIKSEWFAERRAAALVSSPSELSAAPKETVTPAREAILRETIVREVIDWFASQNRFGVEAVDQIALDDAHDHFGVSS